MDLLALMPEAYKAMYGLENYLKSSSLSPIHKHLIKIRASQINGCAYCIMMHTKEAKKSGETEERIYALNAWKETNYYDVKEKALLALTEAVTLISTNHLPDDVYQNAVQELGETYTAQAIMAIATINAWNRLAISSRKMPD